MNRGNSQLRKQYSQFHRRQSQQRNTKSRNHRKEQDQKPLKQLQNNRTKSPLKKFLQLRLGKHYSQQLGQMMQLLQKQKKLKHILDNNHDPSKSSQISTMIEFLKNQQQNLINKLQNSNNYNHKANISNILQQIYKEIEIKLNKQQIDDIQICKYIQYTINKQSKILSIIFSQLQDLIYNKNNSENKYQKNLSFIQLINIIKKSIQNNKKNKQQTNQLMKRILQLEKQNILLTKQCHQIQQEFQYLVQQKLILENKLDRMKSMINNVQEEKLFTKNKLTKKLNIIDKDVQELQANITDIKNYLKQFNESHRQSYEQLISKINKQVRILIINKNNQIKDQYQIQLRFIKKQLEQQISKINQLSNQLEEEIKRSQSLTILLNQKLLITQNYQKSSSQLIIMNQQMKKQLKYQKQIINTLNENINIKDIQILKLSKLLLEYKQDSSIKQLKLQSINQSISKSNNQYIELKEKYNNLQQQYIIINSQYQLLKKQYNKHMQQKNILDIIIDQKNICIPLLNLAIEKINLSYHKVEEKLRQSNLQVKKLQCDLKNTIQKYTKQQIQFQEDKKKQSQYYAQQIFKLKESFQIEKKFQNQNNIKIFKKQSQEICQLNKKIKQIIAQKQIQSIKYKQLIKESQNIIISNLISYMLLIESQLQLFIQPIYFFLSEKILMKIKTISQKIQNYPNKKNVLKQIRGEENKISLMNNNGIVLNNKKVYSLQIQQQYLYVDTLEKLIEQFLFNKVNINWQCQLKGLKPQNRQKLTIYRNKIADIQNHISNLQENITPNNIIPIEIPIKTLISGYPQEITLNLSEIYLNHSFDINDISIVDDQIYLIKQQLTNLIRENQKLKRQLRQHICQIHQQPIFDFDYQI